MTQEEVTQSFRDASLLERAQKALITDQKFSKNFHGGVRSTIDLLTRVQGSFRSDPTDPTIPDKKMTEAMNLMVILHIDQKDRPDGPPYLSHTTNVARRLIEEYGVSDPELVIAALLHDSVEDQVEKLSERSSSTETEPRLRALDYIEQRFGKRVRYIVAELSNPEDGGEELKARRVTMTEQEIARAKMDIYKEHVRSMVTKVNPETGKPDVGIALIKLGDFSDNALNLHNISERNTDGEIDEKKLSKKVKLCVKYAPVIEVFMERISQDDLGAVLGDKRQSVTEALQRGKAYIDAFLQTPKAQQEKRKLLGE